MNSNLLTVDQVLWLKAEGVSDRVINYLIGSRGYPRHRVRRARVYHFFGPPPFAPVVVRYYPYD